MTFGSNAISQTGLEQNQPFKILVVDDDPVFRQIVKRLLLARCYQVMEARSTNEAEPLLSAGPDLLMVDYRMPNVDGAAWIKTLRERGLNVPIVFCSASAYSASMHANLRNVLQVDLIVRKPIVEEDFFRQLESLLPRRREAHEDQWVNDDEPLITDAVARLFDCNDVAECSQSVVENTDQSSENTNQLPLLLPQATEVEMDRQARLKTKVAMRDLATLYLTELPAISRLLRSELLDSREHNVLSLLQTAADQAHSMSGAAGSLGFTEIHKIAQQLEDCLKEAASPSRSGDPLDYSFIGDLLDRLDRAIKVAKDCDSDQISAEAWPILEASDSSPVPRFLTLSGDTAESGNISSILDNYHGALTRSLSAGMSVFSMLDDFRPDLLFIDAGLTGTSAYDICRMIRCNPAWINLPVIFMTDDCSSQCRAQIFQCGASDFVIKPANQTELIMRVSTLLNRASPI